MIRAAITLKLCQHEETGAIVAALTTSIPEHAGSERNWDYRYCWIRDAYYTVQALNRLGALDVLEGYLGYLRNLVDDVEGRACPAALRRAAARRRWSERIATGLAGYRGMGPVRVGNQAYEQIQHDVYGQIVLSDVQAFFDERLFRPGERSRISTRWSRSASAPGQMHDKPDAGLWELRTMAQRPHLFRGDVLGGLRPAGQCRATCSGSTDRADVLAASAPTRIRDADRGRRPGARTRSASRRRFGGDDLDASLIQLLDLRFLAPDDPRFQSHARRRSRTGLRRGSHMLRYATEDDFGLPRDRVQRLHLLADRGAARRPAAPRRRARCSRRCWRGAPPPGLLSEDIDPDTGELWGNYPQTYSLVGLINCAVLLSKPWSAVR